MLDHAFYLSTLARDNELFAAAVAASDGLGEDIFGCDNWTVRDLVGHLGTIQHYVANTLVQADGPGDRPEPPTDSDALLPWAAEGAAKLERELAARPSGTPAWHWSAAADHTVDFWARRMCQEAAVHRYDAELAVTGTAEAIDADLARDGVDEYFDHFLPRIEANRPIRVGPLRVQIRTLDTSPEGAWMVTCGDGGPVVTREHGKGDVALLGPAQSVLLALWGRIECDEMDLEVYGSPDDWRRFQTATAI